MVERLEAAAEAGAEYYMVTVSESVTFSYPALATDAEAAREKVAALIEAGKLYEKTPPQMAHAAKSILKKTGSGKLTPTKRQRK